MYAEQVHCAAMISVYRPTSKGIFTYQQGLLLVAALFMRVKHAIMPRKHLPYPQTTTQFLNALFWATFAAEKEPPFKPVYKFVWRDEFTFEVHSVLVLENGIAARFKSNG